MKPVVSPQQRVVIAVAGLVVVVVAAFVALLSPLMTEMHRLAQEVRTARQQLGLLEVATANEAALRAQHQQVEQAVGAFRQALPTDVQTVIEHLSSLAKDTGVKIQTIYPQQQPETEAAPASGALPYAEVPVQIEALAGYHQLGTFLNLVESGERPMQVASLRIAASPKDMRRHNVKLTLRAFVASDGG